MVVQKHVPVEKYLPGLPSSSSDKANAFLHCRGAADLVDSACFALTVKGQRCSRPRMKHSNFCKQHSHEVLKHERQHECWRAMAESLQDAAARYDRDQLDMAVQLSLAENAEAAKRRAESRAKLAPRLKELSLEALDTVADGSCQFVSICFTAGIPVDPADFRSQVVNFLRHLPHMFAGKISANFTSFEAYLQNMSRPSTWGDELTLQASACLLLAPIRVLSDSDLEPERRFTPPPTIAPEVWGNEIVLCHVGANHYEATAPLAEGQSSVEAD